MEDIKVSVLCTAYNHEKFLRKCLDSFVMQKTSFKFEVIVHDDASTDSTKSIIEEYCSKYPNLIKPIYQVENKYSKGVKIMDDIMYPICKGRYIALCEGDDYWCDENKLQLQYDFMESHPECSACFHNTLIHNSVTDEISYENDWKDIHFMTPEEVFKMGKVHTSSFFVKKEYFKCPDYGKDVWIEDFVKKTTYFKYGQLCVLPQVMSVYNINNGTGSVTYNFFNYSSKDVVNKKTDEIIKFLNKYKDKTQNYDNIINNLIQYIEFCKVYNWNYELMFKANDKQKFYKLRKEIKKHSYYKNYLKSLKPIHFIKTKIKFSLPFWLWKKFTLNKKANRIWME